jgi:hypothetical protein
MLRIYYAKPQGKLSSRRAGIVKPWRKLDDREVAIVIDAIGTVRAWRAFERLTAPAAAAPED